MFPKSETETKLDDRILSALTKLENLEPDTKEYGVVLDHLTKLNNLKTDKRYKTLSPDTMLVVAANIFGVLWIARYERDNVINGKAFGHIVKPR